MPFAYKYAYAAHSDALVHNKNSLNYNLLVLCGLIPHIKNMESDVQKNTVIQGLWIGNELSLMEQLSIQSFLQNGHEYHLYVYDDVDSVPEGTIIKDANSILSRSKVFSAKAIASKGYVTFSNMFRYQLLYKNGGWWVDSDVICLRPFKFDKSFVFLSEFDDVDKSPLPSTAVMKVPAGERFMEESFEIADKADKETLNFGDIGYKLFRKMLKKHDLECHVVAPEVFAPVSWWDCKGFIDPEFNWPDFSDSYGVHLYNEMWRAERIDKSIRYDEKSLYGALQKKYN